ncbi:serine/threonine-protein kinase [Sorangium sp. So ce375]|uniref:serine/threonine-protein kinase n=1 Tax=Sorangium sp. So ce375 TaxID=3133306 RepID=UPI003F5B934B
MSTCPTCRTEHADGVAACAPDAERLPADPSRPGPDPELAPGTLVGEYRVEAKIGAGGFGTVYRAMHPVIGKAAAIKVLSRQCSANPELVSRFVAEARAVNQIRHRNIIDIFSFGALEDGRHYYVMELLEGMTLDAYRRKRGRLPPAEALPILVKIARALDAAHAAGIAHRDLKPENVFLVFDEDGAIFPKLLDFGIAKLLGESSTAAHKTRTGHLIGTPLYMSPEQCRGKNVDHRTDVYSFGILAHELLAGAPPFDGESAFDLLIKHTSEAAPPVSSVATHLSPALDAPLLRMLEKEPTSRPASLLEGTAALVEAARGAGYDLPAGLLRASDAAVGRGAGDAVAGRGAGDAVAGVRARAAATETLEAGLAPTQRGPVAGASTGPHGTETVLQRSLPDKLESTPPAASRRRAALIAAAVLGVAAAAALTLRLGDGGPAAETLRAPASAAAMPRAAAALSAPVLPASAVATTAPSSPPPATDAEATAASADAAPPDVELRIQATPKELEVWSEGKLVGKAPGPLRLPRGHAVKLTFKAPGYQEQAQEVPAEADGALTVALKRAASTARGAVRKGDLENPFQ